MRSEDDPFVGGNEIAAILQTLRGSSAQRVEGQHFGGNETAVKAVAHSVGAEGGNDQPERVDLFAAMKCDGGQRQSAEQADRDPKENAQKFLHEVCGLFQFRVSTRLFASPGQARICRVANVRRQVLWRKRGGFASQMFTSSVIT